MMAFFRQLQLLLWKNGLGIIRRPVWSVTLVLWPVIIFIIIAVTRHHFQPTLRPTCYVGPRNLPSTGFFPFLETIMCNTDSACHNTSRQAHSTQPSRAKRSTPPSENSPLSTLTKGIKLMQQVDTNDPALLLNSLYSFVGIPSTQTVVQRNQTSTGDKETKNLTETAEMFKSALCTFALPLLQAPSPLVAFCKSDDPVLEVVLKTVAQALSERPEDLAEAAAIVVKIFEQLQNETSLWECLQALPHILSPTSPEHLLANLEKLLINLQKTLNIMEHNFPEIKSVTSSVRPILVAGIRTAEYIQNWPGRNVSVRCGDVMTCNESLWQMFSNIEIPLDKAIFLAIDKNMVRDFVCKNSTGLTWLACASETVDMFLGCISPQKLLQQSLLAWSKRVAQHDVIFVKGMLHSLTGIFEGSGMTRTTRSIDTPPQNIEEALFLEVGKVLMEIVQLSPEAEAIVHDFLRVGFHSMKMGTEAMVPVQEILENVVKDVATIKMIVLTLMSDQSQTTLWISKALDSALEIIKTPDPVTCDTILDEFVWVFSMKTINPEVVRSFLCGSTTTIEQTLLKDWMPLVENAMELYGVFMGNTKLNVTLPMILSEWHTLFNKSLGFGGLLLKLEEDWSGGYWMDWMPENSSANHLPSSLQQSAWLFMVKLGQWFEQSQFWPEAKNYFHMAHWILNSTDTSQPNCNMSMKTFGIECDTDFDWDRFSHVLTTLLSPTEELFISCLKRSVGLLQNVYSDLYKHLAASNLQNAIEGGDPLSAFLINMLNKVDDFARNLTTLPDQSFSNTQVMAALYANLLESIGLKPLLPLIMHNGPVNVSQVLEVVSELGRSNQGIFTFNESDPTMAILEKNIMQVLSVEGNFSFSIHLSMSQTLLTYYSYLSPEEVAKLKQAIQPFTNQTSSGIVEAILSSLELLRTIIDAPSGDPTHVILGYIRQLQQLLGSLFQMQRIEQIVLPNGQISPAQVTDLHLLSDIFDLLTPEMIMNLTKAGPVAAQHMIIQKYIQTLPPKLRKESAEFLYKFVSLQSELAKCESDQGCLSGISEMLDFLQQILDMALNTNGNATINIATTGMYMGSTQVMPVAHDFFSLLLKSEDAAYVGTVQEVLKFVSILLKQPDITLSNVQQALQQANLTIEELNELVMWLGAKDINDLLEKITQLQNAQQCFEQISLESVANCTVDMVYTISGLLMRLPTLQNQSSILSTIPMIVNKTVTDMINTNFTSNPQNAAAETLKATLSSVKLSLQLNNMSTPEIQNEMEVFERLINLVGNPEPLKYLNVTPDELYTGVLKLISWYLDPLKNVTSSSSVSHLLEPVYDITRMQVALQLAQMDLIQFITEQVLNLTNSLTHTIDAEGVVKIGQTTIAILQHVLKFVEDSLEAQNAPAAIFGYDPPINMTCVNATMLQINNYINLLQLWMSQANFGAWGNLNNISAVEKDIYHLIQSNLHFFNVDQQDYMRAIGNITQALNSALMSAMQPDGLQSDQFSEALLEAVQSAMDLLIQTNGPLPPMIQQSVLMVFQKAMWLAANREASYAMSLNATLHILQNLHFLINQIFPQELAQYPVCALKITNTYFESVLTVSGPDSINQLILNEMKTIESCLPPNSTAQHYVSTAIKVTKAILQPSQCNQSLWSLAPSEENIPCISVEVVKLLNMLCPLFMGESCEPQSFADLPSILERLTTGQAGNEPTGMPLSVLAVIKNGMWLAANHNASYEKSLNVTMDMLQSFKYLISQSIPQEYTQYPLLIIDLIFTYFESVATVSGPDGLNHLLLNAMKTLESSLPPNITEQLYIPTFINIAKAILQPGQGNRSLLSLGPSEENIPYIFAEVVKVLDMLCPLFMSCKPLGGFADLPHVLELLMTGQASNETWRRLQEFVEVLLSFLEQEISHNDLACFVEMFEKLIGDQVNRTKAQTGLIVSLQTPVMMLITNMTRSLNSSHFNMSEVSERVEVAIEHTIRKCEETNGTMTCQDVLILWEPVREAAGLSPSFMAMWCSIGLPPVIDGYANDVAQYTQQNWTCAEKGPLSAEAVAARMVMTLRSLYHNEMKQSHVTDQFIQALIAQFSALVQQPLSLEAQLNLSKQLQQWQTQSSLQSIRLLSKELDNEFPFLKPYMDAVEKMVTHILNNSQLIKGSDDIFNEVAMILLSSLNIPSNDTNQIMSGTFSSKAWVDMALKIMKSVIDMKVFGDNPTLYHTLEQILASNDTRMVMHKVAEMVSWLTSTQAKGRDFVAQTLTKVQDVLDSLLSVLTNMADDLPPYLKVLHNLVSDAISFIQQLLTSGSSPMANNYNMTQAMLSHNGSKTRHRREASFMPESPHLPKRSTVDDYIDLIYINYPTLLISMGKTPTSFDVLEMFHVLFANPDLETVLNVATKDLDWGLNNSKETVDAVLKMASLLTTPGMDYSSLALWEDIVNLLPDGFPYASLLTNFTRAIIRESPENLRLMQETLDTVSALFLTDWTDPQILEQLKQLRKQVCYLEKTDTLRTLMLGLSLKPGILCDEIVPVVYVMTEGLFRNMSTLSEDLFAVLVGDPKQYKIQTDWTSQISKFLGFNISSLNALNFTRAAPVVTLGEMVRNKTAFMLDMLELGFDPAVVALLTESTLPDNNLVLLSWLVDLRKCGSKGHNMMGPGEKSLRKAFCSMNTTEWYSFSVLMAQHLNTEKFIYRMALPTEVQSLVQSMLEMASSMMNIMQTMTPFIRKLADYLPTIEDLDLEANNQFHQMSRRQRTAISGGATFVTISRALCSNGIFALFGVAKYPHVSMAPPTFDNNPKREEMIERFKIPKNATHFCTNMYLDMVNTTGGAIAWAFLKPMLMGQILFTPNTPQTRAIMNKANSTLQQLADLRHYSRDWIKSSNYIVESSEMLTQTLPMLQNSLGNSFVKNFIKMQTGMDVDSMQETLNNFSNMTELLEKNKDLLAQITTLSTLMVDLSSCITFDRHRGYDTEDELNRVAQELAKNRDLYASVIFKLPKDTDSSRKRRSASSEITLPPKVRYTIRMHMDNVMRTDRARQPFYSKETHISAAMTLRYNRGFIYLQETIDRAIIDIQANKTVTDTAVQIQPFPYPCHHRDEYLEAISFVFPLLLMIAWVLFVADFIKKLVHEREIKLHEYMKMMGVTPFSHFFAWFLESAFFLVLTICILTLVLKCGNILPHSDGFLLFLYLCDYGLSILAFSYLISTFFEKTYIAALSGSLLYVLSFFPFIAVMALETHISFSLKTLLGLFSPTAFSYASQYISRYETQGEGIQWSNSYSSPIAGDTASFGWLCWLMLIDTFLYFIIGAYIRAVFPGKSGIPSPWYFPFKASFWKDLCGCRKSKSTGRGLFLTNILQTQPPVFPDSDGKGKGKGDLSSKASQNFSDLPVGVALYGLTKVYGRKAAIENLNVAFYEGHVTSLLGHNGAGKTTTMSILTGLFPPSSGIVEVYGKDMQANLEEVRQDLGVCMQYDVLFDHMTAKEHLLLYGQIKAPHWSKRELQEQVRMILEETGMYAHRHKRVGTLSGGMKRKLSISIAFIGGSRLVVLDEPTTGVDPCSRRSIWDIVIQHKKGRTIIMSTHHLDEAEVLSDRIAFLERGGLKCCGTPYYLKDQLGQGYKLTLTKKMHNGESKQIDKADLKAFVQAHVPEARLKEAQGSDLVYLLPPFSSNNASSYRSLLTALDSNLDSLQLGCYGISDTTLEEVFLHLTHGSTDAAGDELPTISDTVSDTESINSYPESEGGNEGDTVCFTGAPTATGVKLAWQQMTAILIKRFHHSRRDWKGLLSQILLPVLFVVFAMGLGVIKSDLRHYPELELTPAIYKIGQSYSFFSNPNSSKLADAMVSFPGLDNACLQKSNDQVCTRSTGAWTAVNGTKKFSTCKCVHETETCGARGYIPPHKQIPSSQIVYNVTDLNVENYLVATADDYIRNRYGGYDFGLPLPQNLKMDVKTVPQNRTLSKVWFNPEGHHTMPAYLSSMNNFILRSNLPADKDPSQYAISVSSHPYFGRPDDEDSIVQGMLQIMVALCILAGYSITMASFAIYEVSEYHSGSKRLQHIAGISEPFYWIVNFFYDMVMYLIPVALTVGVIAAFQVPAFTDRQNLGAVAMLLVLFGFSTFPWMYLLSSVFKDAEIAFITFVCINLFLSVNTIIPTSILYFMKQITYQNTESLQTIFDRLSHAFLIFPQFNFGNGLLALARTNLEVQILSGYGIDAYKDPFSGDALGWMMISSFIQGVVFFSLRLLWNKYIVRKVSRLILRRKPVHVVPNVDEDEDVAAEHLRVSSGAASSDVLQVNQLTKVYQHLNKKVPAVKKLSLGVPAGECFGLLGVNGAGKTTTFKMLTGDVSPTDGTAQIRDRNGRLVDIMECRNQGINIGYCPQEDALDDLLTGEEHLYFYARLHGISKRDIPGVVNYLLRRVELNPYRDTIADRYSCGTRRKLSTALALVGHPQILLLDEPSSGMDPRTKRQLWKIITEEVKGKCAVVLTSHSMEECEALCGRLAIMVKGQFRCLGSLQHIKNRFGSGFTVKMYMTKASSDADAITQFMQSRFPSTFLKEQHSAMVEYHVPVAPGGVADIFGQLESSKEHLEIQHFSVSQTTLDEVFINFALDTIGMETVPIEDEFDDDSSLNDVEAENEA